MSVAEISDARARRLFDDERRAFEAFRRLGMSAPAALEAALDGRVAPITTLGSGPDGSLGGGHRRPPWSSADGSRGDRPEGPEPSVAIVDGEVWRTVLRRAAGGAPVAGAGAPT